MRKSILYTLYFVCTAFAIQSCTSSIALDARWKSPDQPTINPNKILVLVVGENMRSRQVAEDAFEVALRAQGFDAVGAFDILPTSQNVDSATFRQIVIDQGCDAVLTARAVNVTTEQHWVPGTYSPPPYYGSYYGYYGRYGYYGMSSPGYMDETTTALLESNLFDATSGKGHLAWVGQSSVIVAGNTEKLVAKYAAVVVKGMIDDGVLGK